MARPAKRATSQSHSMSDSITMTKGRRADSPNWEAIIELSDGKKVTRSTGTAEIHGAERVAIRLFNELSVAVSQGRGLGGRKFAVAADLAIAALTAKLDATGLKGTAAHKFTCPRNIIRNSLKPAFGDLPVAGIKAADLASYVACLKGRKGAASVSTVKNHNYALSMVFDTAIEKGWLKKSERLALSATHTNEQPDPRPPFSHAEYLKLVKAADDEWIVSGKTQKTKEIRQILREVIIICGSTGIRPGTELYGINWARVDEQHKLVNGKHVVFHVSRRGGKRGKTRMVVGYEKTKLLRPSLQRLRALTGDLPFIFSRPSDLKTPKDYDLHGAFELLLDETNLKFDADGDKRSLYSLRHYYAVNMYVQEKQSWEELSKQMGTSPEMLEKYYSSRVTALDHAKGLSGVGSGNATLLDDVQRVNQTLVFDPKSGKISPQ